MGDLPIKKLALGTLSVTIAVAIGLFAQRSGLSGTVSPPTSGWTNMPQVVEKMQTTSPSVHLGKVNINTANTSQLTALRGIGAAKAEAIIAYRKANGFFYAVEDIMRVKGIGKSIFEGLKDNITVGDIAPLSPQARTLGGTSVSSSKPSLDVPQNVSVARVIVTQVMAGVRGNPEYEFIELYNPSVTTTDLTGWSVKKKSSTGNVSTLVTASRLTGRTIPPGKYFLLAHSGYNGAVAADVLWPSSYTLASANNTIMLYNSTGELVDSIEWAEIPDGKSFVRPISGGPFSISNPDPHNLSD